jgi:hypothetical protein
VVEVVGGVMRGKLVGDGALLGAVGLAGVDLGEPVVRSASGSTPGGA